MTFRTINNTPMKILLTIVRINIYIPDVALGFDESSNNEICSVPYENVQSVKYSCINPQRVCPTAVFRPRIFSKSVFTFPLLEASQLISLSPPMFD